MIKKLFLGVLMLVAAPALAAPMVQPTGRPAAAMRAGTISTARMATITGGVATAVANDARCANPLPDQTTAGRCIQKYMACLKQDSVCGEHFESCDTKSRFNTKRIFCQDKLQECPDDGIAAIYGSSISSTSTTAVCDGETMTVARNFVPALNVIDFAYNGRSAEQTNQIAQAIYDGAKWSAEHAVDACRNAADGCIKRACQNSAFKCVISDALNEDKYEEIASNVVLDTGVSTTQATSFRVSPAMVEQYSKNMAYTGDQARNYIKGACRMEVGTNKSCLLLSNGGKVPKDDSWTLDDFEVDMVYGEIMTGAWNRLGANQNKILEWMARGVGTAIDACKSTAKNCVQSACGSGSLAACYGSALDGNSAIKIEQIPTIGPKCTGLINADQNCLDLLVDKDDGPSSAIWEKVWGTVSDGYVGSFGLVGQLNTQLAQMFNETAVKNLRKQCQGEAEACVRRECGDKFTTCYINDKWLSADNGAGSSTFTDGVASATDNAAGGFDQSMARKLCALPVKKSETCQSYFDIQYAKTAKNGTSDSWGTSFSVGSNWNSAATPVDMTCSVSENYQQDTMNEDGTMALDQQQTQKQSLCGRQETNILNDLIADISATARAQLTKEQNILKNACENHRSGSSLGATYMWAKKPGMNDDMMENYAAFGLEGSQPPTADLWGAFCQVKVDIVSTDSEIQALWEGSKASHMSAYFSLGDAVMCGSWMKQSDLDKIGDHLKAKAAEKAEAERSWASQHAGLIAGLLGGVAGAVGGGFAGNMIGKKVAEKEDNKAKASMSAEEKEKQLNKISECINVVDSNLSIMNAAAKAAATDGAAATGSYGWVYLNDSSKDCRFGGVAHLDGANTTISIFKVKEESVSLDNGKSLTSSCGNNCPTDTNYGNSEVRFDSSNNGAKAKLEKARAAIEKYQPGDEDEKSNAAGIGTAIGAGVGGLALGIGAGVMANSIADRSFEIQKLKAGDEAVAAWFNTVGSKIQCKVGGKAVGSYGDMIELK